MKALEQADVVAHPVAREGQRGWPWRLRRSGCSQATTPAARIPMVAEAEPRISAWHEAADALARTVRAGRRVVLPVRGMCRCLPRVVTCSWPCVGAIPTSPLH